MGSFYLGAYWGCRKESASECGQRLARCIAGLGAVDPVLGSWFLKGWSRKSAKTPVDASAVALGELFAKGRNRRDFGGEVIEELGFSVGMWNRAKPEVGLSAGVGMYTPVVPNCFVLDFPAPDGDALRLFDPDAARAIFTIVVEAWEPAWATWTSRRLREAQDDAAQVPVVGWLTYLRPAVRVDVPGATKWPLLDGSVVMIGRDATAVSEEAVRKARRRLSKAGSLRPIA